MGVLARARAHLNRRAVLGKRAAAEVAKLWSRVDKANIAASWREQLPAVLTVVESAQAIAAASAGTYLDDMLDGYSLEGGSEGRVNVAALAGVASDGRGLAGLLYRPAVTALKTIRRGGTERQALAAGGFMSELIVRTQVADAGRAADSVALTARPQLGGWVRMLSLPSCSRCIILAGKWYAFNAGFKRHPACDCIHVPAPEDTAEELTTDPTKVFRSLSAAEQDKIFTKAGAEAIRLGADVSQVVNARKGARGIEVAAGKLTAAELKILRGGRKRGRLETVNVFGQDLYVTTQGSTVRGMGGRRLGARETGVRLPGARYRSSRSPRLMPESILQIAGGDRDEAIRMLKRNGYLL